MRKDFSSARCGGGASQLATYIEPSLLGDLTFRPDPSSLATDYFVSVYAMGTTTPVVATLDLGVPPVNPFTGLIRVNMASFLNSLPPGNYTVTVSVVNPGGTSTSIFSTPFTVPLAGGVAIKTVGPSGRNFTTVQAAVNAAVAGDIIQCDAGVTFTESVTLPNKGPLVAPITITTNASTAALPAPGQRINPSFASFLPKIVSPGSGIPCLLVAPGANNYVLRNIEFPGVPLGFNAIIKIGANDSTQQFYTDEPHHITIDQCYIHGGVVCGQKRGIETHGRYIVITNNYISDIKSVGQDSQGIYHINGHGPMTIVNNTIQAGTEPILFGGADPVVRTYMTCSGGASATGCNVSCSEAGHTLSELMVGQGLSVLVAGVWVFTTLASVTGSGVSGSITFASVGGVPDTPGGLRAGTVIGMEGVGFGPTITGNYVGNDPTWINGVLQQVQGVSAAAFTGGGTLPGGGYFYSVQAFNPNGYQANPVFFVNGARSTEAFVSLGAPGHVNISWTPDPNATIYRVWRGTTANAPTQYHDATGGSYVDDGTAMVVASVPGATPWQVKNLFELKAAQNALVSGNIFQYHWKGNSNGWCIWIKSVNQDGTGNYIQTKNITVEKNIFRHCDGWMEVHGREIPGGSGFPLPGPVTNLTVRHNLIYDSNPTWGQGFEIFACNFSEGVTNFVFQHNTVVHETNLTGGGLIVLDPASTPMLGLTIIDNMLRKETNGIKAATFASGTASLNACTSGGYTYTKNAVADANAGTDGGGNFYEAQALWEQEFVNYTPDGVGADYHLKPTSPYHFAGSDGIDLGCDVTMVLAITANVPTGQ